jgi:hypothetical protein
MMVVMVVVVVSTFQAQLVDHGRRWVSRPKPQLGGKKHATSPASKRVELHNLLFSTYNAVHSLCTSQSEVATMTATTTATNGKE